MEPAPDGRARFHNATPLVTGLLALWKEPFKSALPRAEVARFLAPFGYRLNEIGAAGAEGEIFVLAER
jgi:hypothetical protein